MVHVGDVEGYALPTVLAVLGRRSVEELVLGEGGACKLAAAPDAAALHTQLSAEGWVELEGLRPRPSPRQ